MIASALRALLPLATLTLATVVPEVYSAVEWHDSGWTSQAPDETQTPDQAYASEAPVSMRTARQNVDKGDPDQRAPAAKEPTLHSILTLLSDQSAKDLFGARISKAYYVIEAIFSDDGSSGFAVTGLELRSADGDRVQPTPARLIALQMSRHRKLMPARLVRQEALVLSSSGDPMWLFVEKNRLRVVDGKLPTGIRLFGKVSKVQFEVEVIE